MEDYNIRTKKSSIIFVIFIMFFLLRLMKLMTKIIVNNWFEYMEYLVEILNLPCNTNCNYILIQ